MNADDFGYSVDTVEATIDCFEHGLLTSATIMARMPATDAALAFARTRPDLSFGVHLTFVGDGVERSVRPTADVPDLVDDAGSFPGSRVVRLRALTGSLPLDQLEREIAAQIDVVSLAGITVTHVDSHRHLHKFAPFRKALRNVLRRRGITCVRTVQDVYLRRPRSSLTYWAGPLWRRALTSEFRTTDHFYMPTTAHDDRWYRVASLMGGLEGDFIEIGVHPGESDPWRQREQDSLPSFVDAALASGHELVNWRAVDDVRRATRACP